MGFSYAMAENLIREMLHYKDKDAILLVGSFGTGKSACFKSAAKKEGVPYVDQRLSQCDVGDLKGFPFLVGGRLFFAPPEWFPLQEADAEALRKMLNLTTTDIIRHAPRGILLLDEIDRANREVQQAGFEVVLDRRLNMKPIMEGWLVGAGVNADADVYHVNEMDPAFIDRFALIPFEPTKDEFFIYARGEAQFHRAIIDFLTTYPTLIDPTKEIILNNPGKKLYSRRSWEKFSKFLVNFEIRSKETNSGLDLLDGSPEHLSLLSAYAEMYIGSDTAGPFRNFVATNYKSLSADAILNKWSDATVKEVRKLIADKTKVIELGSLGKLIINYVEDHKITKLTEAQEHNLTEFICQLDNEFVVGFWKPFNAKCKEASTNWFNGKNKTRIVERIKNALSNPATGKGVK